MKSKPLLLFFWCDQSHYLLFLKKKKKKEAIYFSVFLSFSSLFFPSLDLGRTHIKKKKKKKTQTRSLTQNQNPSFPPLSLSFADLLLRYSLYPSLCATELIRTRPEFDLESLRVHVFGSDPLFFVTLKLFLIVSFINLDREIRVSRRGFDFLSFKFVISGECFSIGLVVYFLHLISFWGLRKIGGRKIVEIVKYAFSLLD